MDEYQSFYLTIPYVVNLNQDYNISIVQVSDNLKNDTSQAWQAIIVMLALVITAMVVYSFSQEARDLNLIVSGACFAVLIVFAFLGWVNWILTAFVTLEAMILYFMNRGGN